MKMQPQPTFHDGAAEDAIILAGGAGTRLRLVVSDRPKVLADVAGRPFLDMLIENLSAAGFKRIILSVGFMKDDIKGRYAQTGGVLFAEEATPLGTGGGAKHAVALAHGDDVLVMNGDSYVTGGVDLAAFRNFHKAKGADVTIMLARPRKEKDYGAVSVDRDGRIVRFSEKADESGEHFMSAGIYFLKRSAFEKMPQGAFSIETDFFPKLVGKAFYGFVTDGEVVDIGTPERYNLAQTKFA